MNGVVVRGEDGLQRTLSARAVVLACGGFEGNKEMLTRYLGTNACDLPLLAPGLAFNQGAGIRMAMEIGAGTSGQFDMIHTELVDRRTTRPDAYIYAHPFGIVVNEHGKRFYDEGQGTFEETFELIAFEVWRNQNQSAFFIADQTITSHKGIMVLFDTDKPPVEAATHCLNWRSSSALIRRNWSAPSTIQCRGRSRRIRSLQTRWQTHAAALRPKNRIGLIASRSRPTSPIR